MRTTTTILVLITLLPCWPVTAQTAPAADPPAAITLLVTDPLSKELACDCVAGYAQRRYDALAMVLEKRLGQPVNSVCGAELKAYWGDGQSVGLIVGKHSDVLYQAAQMGRKLYPLAALTDRDGKTTFQGLFVVRQKNAAQSLANLQGYRVIYGPASCDEKHAAAVEALREAHVKTPEADQRETAPACTDAANVLMKLSDEEPAVAVISDYAKVLLEGCHTIPPGALRVIGQTKAIPFITLFATDELSPDLRRRVQKELMAAKQYPTLLKLLESRQGFQSIAPSNEEATSELGWTDFRGARRDGLVAQLPASLERMRTVWTAPLSGRGLGGMAVTQRWVLATDRVEDTRTDYLKMFDVRNGELRFTGDLVEPTAFMAGENLDYGNSIRTTPVVLGQQVFLLDALGAFYSWQIPDAEPFAPTECITGTSTALLVDDFQRVTWGLSATPLALRDSTGQTRLIVNSCSASHTLLAIDPDTLEICWKGPGRSTGYASCITGTFGGRRQIVGYDSVSLGGWDAETGERIWTVQPEAEGDFNVPTPVALDNQRLLVVTESNALRLYAFDDQGVLGSHPVAINEDVTNDTVSPVAVGGKAYCTSQGALVQVDTSNLTTLWRMEDNEFHEHVSLIADRQGQRLLVVTYHGQLLLFDIAGPQPQLVSRRTAFAEEEQEEIYSHPSLVGNRLLIRGLRSIKCLEF